MGGTWGASLPGALATEVPGREEAWPRFSLAARSPSPAGTDASVTFGTSCSAVRLKCFTESASGVSAEAPAGGVLVFGECSLRHES